MKCIEIRQAMLWRWEFEKGRVNAIRLVMAMCEYAFTGVRPNLPPALQSEFEDTICPYVAAQRKRWERYMARKNKRQ